MSLSARRRSSAVAIVSFYASPDTAIGGRRPTALANFLAQRGYEVLLFTSVAAATADGGDSASTARVVTRVVISDRRRGARIASAIAACFRGMRHRASGTTPRVYARESRPESKSLTLKDRLYEVLDVVDNRKGWSLGLFWRLLREHRRIGFRSVVVSGPPFSPFIAACAVGLLCRIPVILDFRDPWYGGGPPRPRLVARLRKSAERALERFCVRHAAAIVATTNYINLDLAARWHVPVDRFTAIANGYDEDALIVKPAPVGRMVLLFAGTIYLNRSPINFLDALKALVERPDVDRRLVSARFVGDCAYWQGVPMSEILTEKRIDDVVTVCGPTSREQVLSLTETANVLVNLAQGQPKQVPGKLFEHIAANRAVLLITEPDSASAEAAKGYDSVRMAIDSAGPILEQLRALYAALVVAGDASVTRSAGIERLSRESASARFETVVGRT